MPSLSGNETGQPYWRSLDELSQSSSFRRFVEAEFPGYSPEEVLRAPNRRQFLGIMGASVALASLSGCRWPREEILPYANRPNNRIPGEPVQFATAFELGGVGQGLVATSVDGRPIKVDGNPGHPLTRGRSTPQIQASVLSLYDPDRSQGYLHQGESSSSEAFSTAVMGLANDAVLDRGAGLVFLSEATSSPSVEALVAQVRARLPQSTWLTYEPINDDAVRAGTKLALGRPYRPVMDLSEAAVILSLDDDFLGVHHASIPYSLDYATRRRDLDKLNRLYVLEGGVSTTGATADHRIAVRPSRIAAAGMQIVASMLAHGWKPSADSATLAIAGVLRSAPEAVLDAAVADAIAKDLMEHAGHCVVTAGRNQPAAAHALATWLNAALGNVGKTVRYYEASDAPSHAESIRTLAERLERGNVSTLVILGGNPVLTAPTELDLATKLQRAATSIHLSDYADETSQACTWHVPRAHYLESWGDTRGLDGTMSVVQPLIAPLYGGRTVAELLSRFTAHPRGAYEITRETVERLMRAPLEAEIAKQPAALKEKMSAALQARDLTGAWSKILHDGFLRETAAAPAEVSLAGGGWARDLAAVAAGESGGMDVEFRPSYGLYDGRFANLGWLQELPDPITKLTWDNAALMAPSDAKAQGLATGDLAKITVDGRSITMPVMVQPGQARGTISLSLGFGRGASAGAVAEGAGFDVYPLRTSAGAGVATGGSIASAGGSYQLVTTQDHHAMESAVGEAEKEHRVPVLIREVTPEQIKHDPHHVSHVVHLPQLESLWQEFEYSGHQWGMAIDLAACTGCNTCVVACQAENNIPVVGKQEVYMGREMHWIRVDRYYRGDPEAPDAVAFQPVTCQHCENAPCEQVCPVAATMHDEEGLNVMVYNRCIGTRYCSNNCPYKVRRFNYFYNHHGPEHPRSRRDGTMTMVPTLERTSMLKQAYASEIEQMVYNPEVTVRSRGVMEKCTFCYQRIARAKIQAKNEWVQGDANRGATYTIADQTILTACQQACPSDAIVFGDLADPKSRVHALHKRDPRAYPILAQLNVKPRNQYLARTRHYNPALKTVELGHGHGHGHGDEAHGDEAHGASAGHSNTHSDNGH